MTKPGQQLDLHHGNCLQVMPTLEAGSIDLVLADPPYGTTACKWDSIIPLKPMWEQLKRLAKPNAAIVVTASQPFTTTLIASNMKMFKYCWVWHKNRPSGMAAAKYRPMSSHEDVAVFGGASFFPIKEKRDLKDKYSSLHGGGFRAGYGSETHGMGSVAKKRISPLRNPTTVQKFDCVSNHSGKLHPTQKPVALMEYLIKTYTNEGDTVLDFTMGSGTTGVACVNLNRNFIGIEKDAEYFEIAKKRIGDAVPGLYAEAVA